MLALNFNASVESQGCLPRCSKTHAATRAFIDLVPTRNAVGEQRFNQVLLRQSGHSATHGLGLEFVPVDTTTVILELENAMLIVGPGFEA